MYPLLYLYWQDNNGKVAEQRYHLPEGESVAQSISRANALRSASLALSSARLTGAALVYRDAVDGVGVAAPSSDCGRNLVCFFENASGAAVGAVRVPSPAPALPYDTSGPWQGIRITRDAFLVSGLIQPLESALVNCVYQWLEPFPTQFVVAGIDWVL